MIHEERTIPTVSVRTPEGRAWSVLLLYLCYAKQLLRHGNVKHGRACVHINGAVMMYKYIILLLEVCMLAYLGRVYKLLCLCVLFIIDYLTRL